MLVGGNIGTPLSAQVDAVDRRHVHVVEASSFQLETTDTFHPWIAVLLNFSPDHLDRHATFDDYAAAKARIFAQSDGRRLGRGERRRPARRSRMAAGARARRLLFSLDGGVARRRRRRGRRDRAAHGDGRRAAGAAVVGPSCPAAHLLADVLAAAAVGLRWPACDAATR